MDEFAIQPGVPSPEPGGDAATPPAAVTAALATPVLLQPVQRPLWLPVTILYSALLVLGIGSLVLMMLLMDRADLLESPNEYLEHVVGRDLDADEYADHLPGWVKSLNALTGDRPGEVLQDAIKAYQGFAGEPTWEFPREQPRVWPRTRRTLIILLAEAGRLDEARAELQWLNLHRAESDFLESVQFAYWGDAELVPTTDLERQALVATPLWARDRLLLRIAEKRGDLQSAAAARARLFQRGKRLCDRIMPLLWGPLVLAGLGLLVILGWLAAGRPNSQVGSGLTVGPWSLGRGYAVLVRGALAGLAVATGLGFLAEHVPVLAGFASLMASVPLLCWGTFYLLRPWGLTLRTCFGLTVPIRRWLPLLLFTFALAAVDFLGEFVISAITAYFGGQSHWAEGVSEDYLWKPWWVVWLDFVDGVAWAPIFEEIGCRGFLYTTIRRRLPTLPAALLTGIIFGSVHFYSLPGFLLVTWSGFIWSLAYEKSRSLLPGILSHSVHNIMAFGWMILFYRV